MEALEADLRVAAQAFQQFLNDLQEAFGATPPADERRLPSTGGCGLDGRLA